MKRKKRLQETAAVPGKITNDLELVVRAYRTLAVSLIKSFVPEDNKDFSLKFLKLIESDPESAIAKMETIQETRYSDDDFRAQDIQQAAWQAGTKQNSSPEDEKKKIVRKKMKQAEKTYNHIGGKPDWLTETVKNAFDEVVKKRAK